MLLKPEKYLKFLGANFLLTLEVVVSIRLVSRGVINTLTKMMHCQTVSSTDSENLEHR